MRKLAVYVHGKGGNATESEHYTPLLPEYDVIGFDYKSEIPWDAKQEFTNLFDNYCKNYDYIVLIANSIGAFYSMNAFSDKQIDKAMFISPVVDMENLITNMMKWANVTENELRDKKQSLLNLVKLYLGNIFAMFVKTKFLGMYPPQFYTVKMITLYHLR